MTGRILLVDDEDDARASLARTLERAGHVAIQADSHDAALAAARAEGFLDLVVTDVVMQGDDRAGLRLVSSLREAGVRAPIVVVTAFADVDKVKQALNLGVAYLVEKPFRAAELLAIVERLLGEPGDVAFLVERALSRAGLTEKELAVARLVLKGLTSAEIARLEGNSDKTIRQHLTQIFSKCGVASRAELFHYVFPS